MMDYLGGSKSAKDCSHCHTDQTRPLLMTLFAAPRIWRIRVILTIVFTLIGAACVAYLVAIPPGTLVDIEGSLAAPYQSYGGVAFKTKASLWGDSLHDPESSPLTLFEDGVALGPAHSQHQEIQRLGQGRYSHWNDSIVFSTIDNSDPSSNGRSYTFHSKLPRIPIVAHLGILAVGWLSAAALIGLWVDLIKRPLLRKPLWLAGNFALCVILIEAASWSLVRHQISRMNLPEIRMFAWLTNAPIAIDNEGLTRDGMIGTGTKNTYSPHPFLNYALNPASKYMGISQFNSRYLIRRTEPIRERSKVAWRALVLGGSTTFNEGIRREEDTWVYRLEQLLRERFGSDYDVINGGVGGYSILDNLLHYTILLRELKPDLVILFTGINDVTPRLIGKTVFDYSNSRTPWNGDDIKWLDVIGPLGKLNVVRLYVLMQIRKGALGHIFSAVQRAYPPLSEWESALQRNSADIYAAHLQFTISTLKSQNQSVLVLPQLWRVRQQNELDRIFGIGVSENNHINEQTARKMNAHYMESLVLEQFLSSDFLDNCHFAASGNEKMARRLSEYLVANQIFR